MPTTTSLKKKLIQNTTAVAVAVGCGSSCRRRLNLSKIFHPNKPNKHKRNRHYSDVHHHDSTTTTTATLSSESPNDDASKSVQGFGWIGGNSHYSDVHHHDSTTATLSSESPNDEASKSVQGFGWIGGNSLAVEKDSSDPYVDFRESMLQMIMEKEIFGKDDLRELLNCFLQLNSPYYHGIIVRAFTEIWTTLPN